jgi:undecaprenyl diphosphate synthase
MELLETSLRDDFLNLLQEGVRFRVIGNRDKLPSHIRELIEHTEKATERNGNLVLQCALSYGGRDEIVRAVREVLRQGLRPEEITEDVMGSLLDTAGAPDPDLIIRTSGELRLSNFLLWQSAYSEFYFTNTLWPDFTKEELLDAIHEYQMRERRFGRIVSGVI